MLDNFELLDLGKALAAIVAGFVLGYEREMKDKSAGLKTITLISLGSTLFTIVSLKMGLDHLGDGTRIASYIVSGVGFLGAGVIFKEGFNIYGLTTASVIWVSAAIGMAIGFGLFNLTLIFLVGSLVVFYLAKIIARMIEPQHFTNKLLTLKFKQEHAEKRHQVLEDLQKFTKNQSKVRIKKSKDEIFITLDLQLLFKSYGDLENYLINQENIDSFTFQ